MEKQHATKCKAEICQSGGHVPFRCHCLCNCDGYHTFDELYEHRITLFIALCKNLHYSQFLELASNPYTPTKKIWKSVRHSDGSAWDGWFIMGIGTEKGSQITYHLPMVKWSLTDFAEQLEKAPEWDGHTPDDVLARLAAI